MPHPQRLRETWKGEMAGHWNPSLSHHLTHSLAHSLAHKSLSLKGAKQTLTNIVNMVVNDSWFRYPILSHFLSCVHFSSFYTESLFSLFWHTNAGMTAEGNEREMSREVCVVLTSTLWALNACLAWPAGFLHALERSNHTPFKKAGQPILSFRPEWLMRHNVGRDLFLEDECDKSSLCVCVCMNVCVCVCVRVRGTSGWCIAVIAGEETATTTWY